MLSKVPFPSGDTITSPLGVGVATVMRAPSRLAQQRLFSEAFDFGFRHFDVAPSYGLGVAESVLGRFLRGRRSTVTIATKIGIAPRLPRRIALLQRPARSALRHFPALRRFARAAPGEVHQTSDFSLHAATRSLELSLRSLQTDYVDLLLLHDIELCHLEDGLLLAWLTEQRDAGKFRHVGIATSCFHSVSILKSYSTAFNAVQTESDIWSPAGRLIPPYNNLIRISHGMFRRVLPILNSRLVSDSHWARRLTDVAIMDINPKSLAQIVTALARRENQNGIVLVGSSTVGHYRDAIESLEMFSASRLSALESILSEPPHLL